METFCTHPSLTSFSPPMLHTFSSDQSSLAERGRDGTGFGISTVLGKLISAIFVLIFALGWSLLSYLPHFFLFYELMVGNLVFIHVES